MVLVGLVNVLAALIAAVSRFKKTILKNARFPGRFLY